MLFLSGFEIVLVVDVEVTLHYFTFHQSLHAVKDIAREPKVHIYEYGTQEANCELSGIIFQWKWELTV